VRHGNTSSQQVISEHLALLEKADLVRSLWEGRAEIYHLNTESPLSIVDRWPQHGLVE
jgi:DNA-binding transcriptional ArsR family regulator